MAKIMIIDDEGAWLQLSEERLRELGHEVQATRKCEQAMALMRADRPDVIVLDLRMPVSGYIMLLAVREEWPNIPVIIHTVYSGYRNDAELLKSNAFAVKSPDLAELIAAIDRVLGPMPPDGESSLDSEAGLAATSGLAG